jgi:hypothetical protein
MAPGLEVIGIAAILDKSGWGWFGTKHMLAYDCRYSFAVNPTIKH